MALRACVQCKAEISTDANPCPWCGKKNPHGAGATHEAAQLASVLTPAEGGALDAQPRVDTSSWPLLHVVFPAAMTLDGIDLYALRLLEYGKRGPFATVTDISRIRPSQVTARHRHHMAEGIGRVSAAGCFVAEAVYADSSVLRGFVTAYSWLRRAAHPLRSFATCSEAEVWARAQLLAAQKLR